MLLSEFVKDFRHLHEAAKRGVLGAQELATYQSARDDLARVLLSAMHASALAGRSSLSVWTRLRSSAWRHSCSTRSWSISAYQAPTHASLKPAPRSRRMITAGEALGDVHQATRIAAPSLLWKRHPMLGIDRGRWASGLLFSGDGPTAGS